MGAVTERRRDIRAWVIKTGVSGVELWAKNVSIASLVCKRERGRLVDRQVRDTSGDGWVSVGGSAIAKIIWFIAEELQAYRGTEGTLTREERRGSAGRSC